MPKSLGPQGETCPAVERIGFEQEHVKQGFPCTQSDFFGEDCLSFAQYLLEASSGFPFAQRYMRVHCSRGLGVQAWLSVVVIAIGVHPVAPIRVALHPVALVRTPRGALWIAEFDLVVVRIGFVFVRIVVAVVVLLCTPSVQKMPSARTRSNCFECEDSLLSHRLTITVLIGVVFLLAGWVGILLVQEQLRLVVRIFREAGTARTRGFSRVSPPRVPSLNAAAKAIATEPNAGKEKQTHS